MSETRLGVDVGGTFTDLVALSDGTLVTAKVPSTPRDQSVGVMNAVDVSEVEAGAVTATEHPQRQPVHHRVAGRAGPQARDQLVDHALALSADELLDPLGFRFQQQQDVVEDGADDRAEHTLELTVHDAVGQW